MPALSATAKELQRATDEAAELRRLLLGKDRQLVRAKAKTADLIDAIYQAARDASLAAPRRPTRAPKRDPRIKGAEWALVHLSDLQYGKRTDTFNTGVAARRITELGFVTAQLAEIERADHPVRNIGVMLGGDMVEGVSVFPGQAYEVDSTIFSQLFGMVECVVAFLTFQLSQFDTVDVWEAYGNHGRIGRKGDFPDSDNFDRMLYNIVRERVEHEPRLNWHQPCGGWYDIVVIGNYRALLFHGQQIKSFGGNTPAFGIIRKVTSWAAGSLPPFRDAYLGHFHQPLVLPLADGQGRIFVNPSIESDNNYAKEMMGATGTPSQRLVFVHPKKGRVTTERLVYLDHVR